MLNIKIYEIINICVCVKEIMYEREKREDGKEIFLERNRGKMSNDKRKKKKERKIKKGKKVK